MRNISIKKMEVFISAAETSSFTEGARRSQISLPGAISIINEIENTVGVELFIRTGKTRRAKLTPRGKEVYETLVKALSIYDQTLGSICGTGRKRKVQTLWIQAPYASAVSSSWLRNLMRSNADRHVSIRSAEWHEIMAAIENREEYVALMDGYVRPRRGDYYSLGSIEMVLAIPRSNGRLKLHGDKIAWENVPSETLLYSAVSPSALDHVYENMKMAGAARGDFTEVNCVNILRNFTKETGSPVIIPRIVLDTLSDSNELKCVEFAHSKVHIPLGLSLSYSERRRLQMTSKDLQKIVAQGRFA